MHFVDVINRNNQTERVYIDRDAFVSKDEFSFEDKNTMLLDILKEMSKRNDKRGINTKNKPFNGKNKVVTTVSASTYKNGKRVPIFSQKEASDLTMFSDGTYDYNEVKSQNYNDKYFNFKELKELL